MIEPDVKQCCALAYGSDAARYLLGDSFHPGGVELTLELAGMLGLGAGSRLLDVASGTGTSALAIAERFGCRVVGIDLSAANVARANADSAARGLSERVEFRVADAETMPFECDSFDALLCECAFCTFPDKTMAAAQFARVVRAGGTIGLSDLTRAPAALPELDGVLAWIACIGDARPAAAYRAWLEAAGFRVTLEGERNACLTALVNQVRARLMVADIMVGLKKLALPGFDLPQAKRFAEAASRAIHAGTLGYAILVAERSPA